MILSIPDMKGLFLSLAVFLLCNAIGIIISKGIWSKVTRITTHVSEEYAEILGKALQGMPALWGALLGSYSAIRMVEAKAEWLRLLDGIVVAAGIFSITMVTARIFAAMATIYARRAEGAFPSASILANIIEAATYVTGVLIILQTFGVSIAPILTALGVGGLAVALALQDTLANVFSGLHILLAKPIQAGDYIKLSTGEEGHVMDISWRNTTIRALGNSLIIVPNQKIASAIIINYDKPDRELAVSVSVGVSYASDLDHVEKVTLTVAKEVMDEMAAGIANFEPVVRFHTFGDSSILLNVILRVEGFIDQFRMKHELIKRLHTRYNREGIEIPFPIRTIHMKSVD
ncbi:mechanosensitive ion channel family protein [Sporomusa malonica]|uniref:Small-conductance mechanosensitive channel n=1 Tax=Sporomusa malonica TaxID=112901 RepID=A0A1W2EDI7_9FIRM|nr:mechanosensitive ion channel family protein [Sporomusa malonica]SMD07820.1 Small-conductance mechanosensitive channel [Sporomusa malonica]